MDIDYKAIKEENLRKYGTDIGRIGDMLLANRYDDRTHFIYEILQNAEDALKKRGGWEGSRAVEFSVSSNTLKISHFGKPFDEADVRGICGIGESTKELTDIGSFGIGFKSVYAFTDTPEIHSGQDHFAIDSYVWPRVVEKKESLPDETAIRIPFREDESAAQQDILQGLRRFGPRTLLFLREIEEISWVVNDGPSGLYFRHKPEDMGRNGRIVMLIGQDDSWGDVKEEWLAFSREVFKDSARVGYVEIAFALSRSSEDEQKLSIAPIEDSPLAVFFPTVITTHLGFIVQGPYRTTPSRDNVPEDDDWNQHLVKETAKLLVEGLRQLRDFDLLDVSAIECLPLSRPSFIFGNRRYYSEWRFGPLFEAVREVLMAEPLLPAYTGGHITGQGAKLARSQDLRDLLDTEQLAALYSSDYELGWLSEEITQDRSPRVHEYLTSELDIDEVTPESLVRRLSLSFLQSQSDNWMERLYGFLNGRGGALLERLKSTTPIVRLEDDSHIVASSIGKPNAYLPGDTPTAFPTIKPSVCKSEEALKFLKGLGLRVPDPVDDVIDNILPKYSISHVNISDQDYENDMGRILNAFDTDSVASRTRLTSALRNVKFVAVVDASKEEVSELVLPADAYMATERLTGLFEGVPGVLLVDNSRDCLKGESIRDLLRLVRVPEYLLPVKIEASLTSEEKRQLRIAHPWASENITREISVEDYTLRGLDTLLGILVAVSSDEASRRAKILWQALRDVQNRTRDSAFEGRYSWFYYTDQHASFPANFVEELNKVAWVPDGNGVLHPPGEVVFEDTGWEEDPALAARIKFKPGEINELAKVVGIEPGLLDVLKSNGITTEAQIIELLGISEASDEDVAPSDNEAESAIRAVDQTEDVVSHGGEDHKDVARFQSEQGGTASAAPSGRSVDSVVRDARTVEADKTKAGGRWEFRSYIAVSSDEPNEESSGLSHEERLRLEDRAIDLIISEEPDLQRTPTNNPGFDLMEVADGGEIVRFIEVKAMSGTLQNRSATLTKKQFECAQQERDSYWLYIVENAGDPQSANIVKINDLAGWAKTFTFDHGWKEVSQEAKSD